MRILVLLLPCTLALAAEPAQDLPMVPPLDSYNIINQKNLFSPDRQPRGSNASSADAQAIKGKWLLSGVVIRDQEQLALFTEIKGPRRLTLAKGQPLDDNWQLISIQPQSVTLQAGDEKVELELKAAERPKARNVRPQDNNQRDNRKGP